MAGGARGLTSPRLRLDPERVQAEHPQGLLPAASAGEQVEDLPWLSGRAHAAGRTGVRRLAWGCHHAPPAFDELAAGGCAYPYTGAASPTGSAGENGPTRVTCPA